MPPPGPMSLTLQVPPVAQVAAIGSAVTAGGFVTGTVTTGAMVTGTGTVTTGGLATGVVMGASSAIVGFANTLLSATTGREGVATSVDSKTGTGSTTPGAITTDACSTAGGSGDVANHSFLLFTTPHTHTTDFFLRTTPGLIHATERP